MQFQWRPSLPDLRDFLSDIPAFPAALANAAHAPHAEQVTRFSLRAAFPPPQDQGQFGTCTAHAGIAAVAHLLRQREGAFEPSRMYAHRMALEVAQGAKAPTFRDLFEGIKHGGLVPEDEWPYSAAGLTAPIPLALRKRAVFPSLVYARHDDPGSPRTAVINRIRDLLRHGIPSTLGYYRFPSGIPKSGSPDIRYPQAEAAIDSHAVLAVGYDDNRVIADGTPQRTVGALEVRGSYGPAPGDGGYFNLPYAYVLNGNISGDFWSVVFAP